MNVASALETPVPPVSPSDKKSGSKSGTDASPTTRTTRTRSGDPAPDPALLQVPSSFEGACNNQKVVTTQSNNWQCPGSPTLLSPLPLDLVYEFWHTYFVSDEEESGIGPSLESNFDGDIFGVGKRPVQREIEKDGCIQLVFIKE